MSTVIETPIFPGKIYYPFNPVWKLTAFDEITYYSGSLIQVMHHVHKYLTTFENFPNDFKLEHVLVTVCSGQTWKDEV
jgi:hypothetical protein